MKKERGKEQKRRQKNSTFMELKKTIIFALAHHSADRSGRMKCFSVPNTHARDVRILFPPIAVPSPPCGQLRGFSENSSSSANREGRTEGAESAGDTGDDFVHTSGSSLEQDLT